jgi:TolB protein
MGFAAAVRLCLLLLLLTSARAEIEIPVEKPELAPLPIAIPDFSSTDPGPPDGSRLAAIIRNDLFMTGLFRIIEPNKSLTATAGGDPHFQNWAELGAQALVTANFRIKGNILTLEARLYDVALKKMELGKRFSGNVRDHRFIVHRLADRILEKLTGSPGCFCSRIAFVSTGRTREVFTMDFDGWNLRQVTRNGSINLSPEWAPDGKSIIFTSYVKGNPDLWSVDLGRGTSTLISSRRGINAAARYSPDGRSIALSMSAKGIPKIFIISPRGNIIKRLTRGRGNDISPTWSPDGSTIAYVSDQAGNPQIYLVSVNGGQPKRLTFDTTYNTDPDWSPRGDLIAFTARIKGRFEICTIRTDGTDLRVLTGGGSNTAPAWSPDGRMIAFSSNRDGSKRIYVMDRTGEILVRVSRIPGKAPAWCRRMR